jgi:hypothetical protein
LDVRWERQMMVFWGRGVERAAVGDKYEKK